MASPPFRGSLRYKRKTELVEIATALHLPTDPSSLKKEEIEELLRDHLVANRPNLYDDENFTGLYESLDLESKRRRSARSSSVNGAAADSDASDGSPEVNIRSPRKHSQKAAPSSLGESILATPIAQSSTQAAAAANQLTSSIKQKSLKAKQSLDKLVEHFTDTAREAAEEIQSDVHEVQGGARSALNQAQVKVSKVYKRSKKQGHNLFLRSRAWLSDTKNLTLTLLALEAASLVLLVTPTTFFEIGSRQSSLPFVKGNKGFTADLLPHYVFTVPNLWALLTLQFWKPLVVWTLWSVLIPGAIAHLVTFDRKSNPSTLSFLLSRLSTLIFFIRLVPTTSLTSAIRSSPQVLGVAAGEVPISGVVEGSYGLVNEARNLLSYNPVSAYLHGELQIWATTTVLGFAVYEALATRPRAV
ncbi:hypothetical protein IE53DRAFT_385991 [Violaceomyces palustris]|uniref:Uncharacterized protein n=1 Tax=Violaceomyces palustris TaxID=1673888 RepID=A0ACD0P0U3_9BASI|nr:hypothetical protein IE53DRAFT_385991 [Violaceomyces palustris]